MSGWFIINNNTSLWAQIDYPDPGNIGSWSGACNCPTNNYTCGKGCNPNSYGEKLAIGPSTNAGGYNNLNSDITISAYNSSGKPFSFSANITNCTIGDAPNYKNVYFSASTGSSTIYGHQACEFNINHN
jgi:hypothetical protein